MGRSRLVTFTVEFTVDRGYWTPSEWRVSARYGSPGYGRPTTANLDKHIAVVEKSTQPGGVNEHIGPTKILSARIIDQRSGKTVATWSKH